MGARKTPTKSGYLWPDLQPGDSHFKKAADINRVQEAWMAYRRRNPVCRDWVLAIFESGSGVT